MSRCMMGGWIVLVMQSETHGWVLGRQMRGGRKIGWVGSEDGWINGWCMNVWVDDGQMGNV